MRFIFGLALLIGTLALAACASATPTPVSVQPTTAALDAPTLPPDQATAVANATAAAAPTAGIQSVGATPTPLPAEIAVNSLPDPGTIQPPATEDPNVALVFDQITFERTGGSSPEPLLIIIRSDGSAEVNGQPQTVAPEVITALDAQIDQLEFFGIQGIFSSPGAPSDVYQYVVTVDRAGASQMLTAQDGLTPNELLRFFAAIVAAVEDQS